MPSQQPESGAGPASPAIVRRLRAVGTGSALLAALIGALSLVGWVLDLEVLKGALVAGITMKTNAAIGLLLMGLSQLAPVVFGRYEQRWSLFAACACAAAAGAIGALTLAEHLIAIDLGIDQLFFRERAGAVATQSPNRMGPVASTCLLLLGSSRALALGASLRMLEQRAAALVALVTAVPLLGYLFDARLLFSIGKYTGIALPTAVALWLLASSSLMLQPEVGFMRRVVGQDSAALLTRRLLPAAVLVPVVLMLLHMGGQASGLERTASRALFVVALVLVFTALVWRTGDVVSRQARRAARAERELREQLVQSLELFRTLGEAVPDLLWMSDSRGDPLYQNPAWMRYAGTGPAEAPQAWHDLVHEADRARISELEAEARAAGSAYELEARLRRHDGTYRWFVLRKLPVRDEGGRVVRWIGTGTDIDDRKRNEEALAAADRRKTEFLAVLAHELRNPLAPVRNAVHLLSARGEVGAETTKLYAVIERQIEHVSRLIDDLMDVSRISQDKLDLRKTSVSLTDVVEGALDASRMVVESRRHRVTVTMPPERVRLNGDRVRLVQVFTNLLTNAARYTPSGGHITLSAEVASPSAEHEGRQLCVRVSDTGVGIEPELLEKVFDLFFQAPHERKGHGLGIGLSLVRKLVELHGGRVSARSTGPGQGSTFEVWLPLDAQPQPVAALTAAVPVPAPALPALAGLSVLVVEDNEDSAEVLTELLELAGAEVQTANDGESALALATELEPQVVLLDIGLPTLSGYDVAREIRRSRWGAHAFIVALTGWGQAEDRARSREAGFDRHLVKPVEPARLMALLSELRRSPTPPPAGTAVLGAAGG